MTKTESPEKFLEELEFLFAGYSKELRATTQPFIYARMSKRLNRAYDPADELIRETLMEHVGSLPVLAVAMYPYINDPEVDLGHALELLAIHDIGELTTGDDITFTKERSSKDAEREAALKLLHPMYHKAYDEMESRQTKTAQFAKAIDKINPDILDYLTPAEITIPRYKHFVGVEADDIVGLIVKHKRPYMLWNPFMTEFHILLMDKLAKKLA